MNHDFREEPDLSDEQIARLISAADPRPDPDLTLEVDQVWAQLEATLEAEPDPVIVPLQRRRRRYVVAGTIVAAVALSAAAPIIATRTGVWNTPEWTPAGGQGEFYRLDGTDFPAQLRELATDIPYPDEDSRGADLQRILDSSTDSGSAEASTSALRAEIARGAICAWVQDWLDADAATDIPTRQADTDALEGALTWQAVTDVDPHPQIDGDVDTRVGFRGPTVFGHLPGIIDAANAGDAARLVSTANASYCFDLDLPDAPPSTTGR